MSGEGQAWPEGTKPPWWTDPTENVNALVETAIKRQDDLRSQEFSSLREEMKLRAQYEAIIRKQGSAHAKELRQIETARLDAIRLVDVGAVQRAAEVQATQASALAAQVVATADAFRVSLGAALEPIQKDIRDLRDAQSRGVGGKEQVTESRDVRGESRLNMNTLISIILGGVAIITLVLYVAKK